MSPKPVTTLDGVEDEQRAVAIRLQTLIKALGYKRDSFAAATMDPENEKAGLRGSEISVAVNGGQLAKTSRWINAVARAAGVDRSTADDYLRGRISIDDLMQRRSASTVERRDLDALSPNKRAAIAAYDWTGVEPHEYEAAHQALAGEHYATGIDPDPAYFGARIKKAIAEARGTAKTVAGAPTPDFDPDAESPEVREARERRAAEKAAREAAKKKPPPKRK